MYVGTLVASDKIGCCPWGASCRAVTAASQHVPTIYGPVSLPCAHVSALPGSRHFPSRLCSPNLVSPALELSIAIVCWSLVKTLQLQLASPHQSLTSNVYVYMLK